MKLFFDGGLRPVSTGSGGMELAVVAAGRTLIRQDLGPGTSMDAEWLALLEATRVAADLGPTNPVLLGDAAAVIAQANGTARCPPAYRHHFDRLQHLPRTRIRYIRRTQNLAGIALARLHPR